MNFFPRKDGRDPYRRLSDANLLERIRTGDQGAEAYVWLTYSTVVSVHMEVELKKYGKPEQLGTADDYAHEAILFLLDKARQVGAALLKHSYTRIGGWLKQTATNFMRSDIRDDNRNDRDEWQDSTETEDAPRSKIDTLEDSGADAFADMSQRNRDQVIREVLNSVPDELRSLVEIKFMKGWSWQETAQLMMRLYPDHKPPFELAYLQKTYWDRVHKKPFIKRLGDDLDDL